MRVMWMSFREACKLIFIVQSPMTVAVPQDWFWILPFTAAITSFFTYCWFEQELFSKYCSLFYYLHLPKNAQDKIYIIHKSQKILTCFGNEMPYSGSISNKTSILVVQCHKWCYCKLIILHLSLKFIILMF